MHPLPVRIAYALARRLLAVRFRDAASKRDESPEAAERLGRYVVVAVAFALWVVMSIGAYIVTGRPPLWSSERFALTRWETMTPHRWK